MNKHFQHAVAAAALALCPLMSPTPAVAQTITPPSSQDVTLSTGSGRMVRLDARISDLFIADPAIADVQIKAADQLYIFGKGAGETSIYATNAAGRVVYSATVRVGNNMASVGDMLRLAMPDAKIQVTPMNGMVLLTGTVAGPGDIEDATRLSQAFVGDGTKVISRIRTATPLQVMLKVTIAEVSRSLTKNISSNLQAFGSNSDGAFAFARGRDVLGDDGRFVYSEDQSTFAILGRVLGLDVASGFDASEDSGLVSVLAEPTLTALSGETASFLAGGEFPVPIAEGINGTSVEFKEYGVSLAFTPTVLDAGRISMRVRPEVSELTSEGAIVLNNLEIPGLTTRRTETTVELGSGQSLILSGLLRNNNNNVIDRTPFLGNLPIIGALFRSTGFRRNQTELVIVVTPYLVKPVDAGRIALPTDGYRIANDPSRLLLDREHGSRSGEQRPKPSVATAPAAASAPRPGFGL